ncbi:MAG: chemotaxis protein CheW [Micavibrio sp.]|nr:chemotaxis protein CheW [Micavibrio sp.]
MQGADAYLSFRMDDQSCCLPVSMVQGVVQRLPDVSRAALAPAAVVGITHLRGRIAAIISLRRHLGLPEEQQGAPAHIVAEYKGDLYCLGVDAVDAVIHLNAAALTPPPRHLTMAWKTIVSGVVTQGNDTFALLDLTGLLEEQGLEAAS